MESSQGMENIVDLNSNFCIQMANHVLLKQAEKGSNFVVSPLSFQLMFSLIAMGSTGRTLDQLLYYLRSASVQELKSLSSQIVSVATKLHDHDDNSMGAGPLVTFVNGAWVDQSISLKPSFEALLRDVFKAETRGVDFANKVDEVVEEVNIWVLDATKGLIKDVIPVGSLDNDTALVFSNALYFKGSWDRKFDLSNTRHKDFHLVNGHIVQVPFMTSKKNERHLYHNGYDCDYKILKIPYQNGQDTRKFSMYIFLPHQTNCLQNLVKKFNSIPGFFSQDFTLWEEEIRDFWIPKFKFAFEFEASEIVRELGLELPFSCIGEFNEMVDSSDSKICVSKIFHKAYIEVDEEGTEAAASTALKLRKCSASYPIPSFVADHPFMFIIREETSRIVFFVGAVLNPSPADQVVEEVNLWVEDVTKGLIKELLPAGSLSSDTALVFSNALYFKGAWDRKFDLSNTRHKDFHLANDQIIQVPYMTSQKNERHLYHNGYDCDYKILKIPYQNGQDSRKFSMYFFLPHEKHGLRNIVTKFNSIPGFFSRDFELWEEEIREFWIPKFKFSFEFEASEIVKELGLELPFIGVGEFNEMVDSCDKLCVSKIFHKSYIEVNEEGTEAAASTALEMRWLSATYPTPNFVAHHPFLFVIREETSRIVFFVGAVLNPLLLN